jgi:hypothetical protein
VTSVVGLLNAIGEQLRAKPLDFVLVQIANGVSQTLRWGRRPGPQAMPRKFVENLRAIAPASSVQRSPSNPVFPPSLEARTTTANR